jgi:methanogenic corrinoid protein MtbC1
LCAAGNYRPTECDQIIAMAFALLPASDVIRDVLAPALREVGDRWHRGEFTIAQERIASGAARRQLSSLLNTFNGVARGPSVVFATVSGERHELGILMYAALAASLMVRAYYLGPDLPPEEIGNYARRVDASAVAVSLVMRESIDSSLEQLRALRRALPASVEMWIGGPAAAGVDPVQFPAGSIHMVETGEFEQRVGMLTADR